jgi:cell division transport system ATP-binding protein
MIEMHGISLIYPNGVEALTDINLYVEKGEFVFLVGATGSGKSSLLKLIYREVVPTNGDIYVHDRDITDMKRREIPYLRRHLGVVFQDFKLIPHKTVFENVAYALEVTGSPHREVTPKVNKVLDLVNLQEKRTMLPGELSGGEQQRTSLARAIVNSPLILLADEPTGNLDPDSSWEIMQILNRINVRGTTVLMATHNKDIVDMMKKRVIVLSKGRISVDQEKGSYFPLVESAAIIRENEYAS